MDPLGPGRRFDTEYRFNTSSQFPNFWDTTFGTTHWTYKPFKAFKASGLFPEYLILNLKHPTHPMTLGYDLISFSIFPYHSN